MTKANMIDIIMQQKALIDRLKKVHVEGSASASTDQPPASKRHRMEPPSAASLASLDPATWCASGLPNGTLSRTC